jgi:alkanesulfonate monooxygenase SsuD/methylene tetrahydromethanopterin reductase-like flavin-dependent oxidoreductase (luciferase family)
VTRDTWVWLCSVGMHASRCLRPAQPTPNLLPAEMRPAGRGAFHCWDNADRRRGTDGAGALIQHQLFGTPKEVVDEVKRRIDDLAPGGGFVFSPIHNVQTGVPPENVVAMFETTRQADGRR